MTKNLRRDSTKLKEIWCRAPKQTFRSVRVVCHSNTLVTMSLSFYILPRHLYYRNDNNKWITKIIFFFVRSMQELDIETTA
jgi:hypothetical protein